MKKKIILSDRIYIPKQYIKRSLIFSIYVRRLYTENICVRCPYKKERHCGECEECGSYKGAVKLFKETKNYYGLPLGELFLLKKKLGISLKKFIKKNRLIDNRANTKSKHKIKFTGNLFTGKIVEGRKTANQQRIVDDWLKYKQGFIEAMPRTGKCLVGSTLISTSMGFLHLNELIKECGYNKIKKVGISTLKGNNFITHTYKGKAKTFCIETKNGFTIEGTPEHKIKIITSKAKIVWRRLDELKLGDWVITNSNKNKFVWPETDQVSIEVAKILGYMTANGRGPKFYTSSKKIRDNFIYLYYKAFGFKCSYALEKGNVYCVKVSSQSSGKYFRLFDCISKKYGYCGKKAKYKSIPLSIRQSSKKIMQAYLSAYFSCDCTHNGGTIDIISASKTLITQIHVLLYQAYGIKGIRGSYLSSAKNSKTPVLRRYWKINLAGYSAYSFMKSFPLAKVCGKLTPNKNKASQWCSHFDCLPYFPQLIMSIVSKMNFNGVYYTWKGHKIKRCWPWVKTRLPNTLNRNKSNEIDWETLLGELKKVSPKVSKRISRILNRGYEFEKITFIKKKNKVKKVYDVTVDTTHEFMANGICSHNTALATYLTCSLKRKTLVVAHQEELLKQFRGNFVRLTNVKKIEKKLGHKIVGIARTKEDFKKFSVCLITYQSFIHALGKSKIKKWLLGKFGFVIVDEAHLCSASAFSQFLINLDCKYRLGLSATTERKDGLEFIAFSVLGPIVARSFSTALVPNIIVHKTGVYAKKDYTAWVYAMKFLCYNEERNKQIVRMIFKYLREGRNILIATDFRQHVDLLVKAINKQAKINNFKRNEKWPKHCAVPFMAGTNRDAILKNAQEGVHKVTVAIRGMVKHGLDISAWDTVISAIPTNNPALFYQLSCRGCTPHRDGSEKNTPLVVVLVDGIGASIGCFRSLMSKEVFPKLKGEHPRYKLDEDNMKIAKELMKR